MTRPWTSSGTPSRDLIPFSRRIGLRMSAWSTSAIVIARFSAAMRPAKPPPSGMRTPCSTSSSMPLAARACSAVALQQQDRDGVDREDVGHPLQQLLEELLLRQVGERRVRDLLDRPQLAGDELRRLARVALARVELRLRDRERGAVGGQLQQVAVVVVRTRAG